VLTEHEESSLEQKLSAAMTYANHEHPHKAAVALDDLIDAADAFQRIKNLQ
jgi:hypothetical protein